MCVLVLISADVRCMWEPLCLLPAMYYAPSCFGTYFLPFTFTLHSRQTNKYKYLADTV
jgi:hypothetical protein